MQRSALLSGGLLGLFGVIFGAFGAHALQQKLADAHMQSVWETAVHFEFFHAVALVAIAGVVKGADSALTRRLHWAVRFFTVGVLLFSGSLYALALGAPHALGFLTPVGGVLLALGWGALFAASRTILE